MPPEALSIPDLRKSISGEVIAPGDADYDAARASFYPMFEGHPQVVVRPADAADVARTVQLAAETGLDLAVRSGGHSPAGHSLSDGILLDLQKLDSLDVDVEQRTAWAGAGLRAGEYSKAVAKHGLATGFGDTASVGIGGITLSGGIGYLSRKYGMTIDSLLAAEIVTADGQQLRVDEKNHPDLFWAIRGGGGNFGVVTRFQYQLQPVDQIVGGLLFLPATAETIAGFIAAANAAPDELSTIANVMPVPPMPFVDKEHHGSLAIMAIMAYSGPIEQADAVLAPFRALATPLADLLRPIPYPEIYPPEEGGQGPLAASRTMFIDNVDVKVAETILEHLRASSAMMPVTHLRVLGGAMARVPDDATAFGHRQSKIMANVAAVYGDPAEHPTHVAWVAEFSSVLQQSDAGAYVGFVGDEGQAGVQRAYPEETRRRLAAVKTQYDPGNLFRRNQNVPPAS